MTIQDKFEALHPDLIQSFIKTNKSDAIPAEVQNFIRILDRIPELQRQFPSITTCAKKLQALYPEFNLAFHTAREYIYTAINYFHLNSTVRNESWDQYYADKAEELHHICVANQDLRTAKEYLMLSHDWRLSKKGNEIDVSKIKPMVLVMRPDVTPRMMGLEDDVNLKTLWAEKRTQYDKAVDLINKLDINSDEKKKLINEAGLNLNIHDAEIVDDEQ